MWIFTFFSVLRLLCLCTRLFICALWSPAGKCWPHGSRLWCLTVSFLLSHWYPGSGVVLDCIDSWSLHPYLLSCIFSMINRLLTNFKKVSVFQSKCYLLYVSSWYLNWYKKTGRKFYHVSSPDPSKTYKVNIDTNVLYQCFISNLTTSYFQIIPVLEGQLHFRWDSLFSQPPGKSALLKIISKSNKTTRKIRFWPIKPMEAAILNC